MMIRLRALVCLVMLQMAACTAVPISAPAAGRSPAAGQIAATRTSIAVFPVRQASPQVPELTAAPSLPTVVLPIETAAPSATPPPTMIPVLPTQPAPQTNLGPSATPVIATASFRQPWQYVSGAFSFQRPLIYRLRYPMGWFALRGEGGAAVLQNFPPSDDDTISYGRIRVEISAAAAAQPGGFPAPNQKLLAAGQPGTRQVLVDSTRGVTVWNVRLYGLSESSVIFQLTGYISGSPDPSEGVRLLDQLLGTLELYAWPEPTPAPVAPDYSPVETWQQYVGRLEAGSEAYKLHLFFPPGWWAYPEDTRWVDLTNWVLSDLAFSGTGASTAGVSQPAPPGSIRLSISAAPCTQIGGCPLKPGWLNNDMPGTREITQSANGDTLWLVYLYREQTRFTLSAILSGSEEQVQGGILVLNMMLRTLDISP